MDITKTVVKEMRRAVI